MRRSDGFTLIELLIVVVIIGILAAIAIPKFSSTRQKAYLSTMKQDLKNLASQQEVYYGSHFVYTTSLTALEHETTDGVTLGAVTVTGAGWSATTTHPGTPETCAVFYGDAAAVSPATTAGVITCG